MLPTVSADLRCVACRPGDGTLPNRYVPVGTQVGTPAWVPDEVEEDSGLNELDTGVAKHWFVHIRRLGHRASDRPHVKMDTAGYNSQMSSSANPTNWPSGASGASLVSLGQAGKLLTAWMLWYCCRHQCIPQRLTAAEHKSMSLIKN